MSRAFKLPDLGEGIHEAEVVAILVKEGDEIQEGQPFMEVETDKARVEIPSPFTGSVLEIKARQDETVKVGSVLVVFGDPGETTEERQAPAGQPETARPEMAVGAGIADRKTEESRLSPAAGAAQGAVRSARDGPVPASPATRRLARELNVDLRRVDPSGPAGLVTAQDVRRFAERGTRGGPYTVEPAPALAPPVSPDASSKPEGPEEPFAARGPVELPVLPDFTRWGACEKIPLKSVRRATARHMAVAWSQVPHVNHQESADVTVLEDYRRAHRGEIEGVGGKLTTTVFVMKAVVAALKMFPRFNCSLDIESEEIILKRYFHLGVAVDTDRGLVVPVVRDVDRKSIAELSVELSETSERARKGETPLEEMQGGTFTITNIGALGGTGFSPIVNYPEVAILGMGRARLQPVVLGDQDSYQIVPRLMLPLVLAFDHRVLDGADAARFMAIVVESLEHPDRLWLRI